MAAALAAAFPKRHRRGSARAAAAHLLSGLWQCSALKALRDAQAQARGVLQALEEVGVLRHAGDAKRVVHAPARTAAGLSGAGRGWRPWW